MVTPSHGEEGDKGTTGRCGASTTVNPQDD